VGHDSRPAIRPTHVRRAARLAVLGHADKLQTRSGARVDRRHEVARPRLAYRRARLVTRHRSAPLSPASDLRPLDVGRSQRSRRFARRRKGTRLDVGIIGRAAGLFAVTNIDDILLLALFFAAAGKGRAATTRIVLGQYLGFTGILAVAVAAALGTKLLPETAIPYLGLLPIALGVRAAWTTWRERRAGPAGGSDGPVAVRPKGPTALEVAAVTFANGGDNIGVYVPVFAASRVGELSVYAVTFLVLVAVWCFAGRSFVARPAVAKMLSRWGHVLLPLVLVALGAFTLVEGGAFGL